MTVSTNNLTGYTLSMSMGTTTTPATSNALIHTLDSHFTIDSITSSTPLADLPANHWGYNVPTLSSHGTNYQPLPNPREQHIIRPDGQQGTETTQVNFATKINNQQHPGQYQNSVLFTATTNEPPTLQPKAILGDNGNLNFVYDTNHYEIGQQYEDNLGTPTITAVYDYEHGYTFPYNPTGAGNIPWAGDKIDPETGERTYRPDITSANFEPSFCNYLPTRTSFWFANDRYISSITNIKNFNTSESTAMNAMFQGAGYEFTGDFTLDLSELNTSKVTTMANMFQNAGAKAAEFKLDLSKWNTSSVIDMQGMFSYYQTSQTSTAWSIGDIGNWDTSNVTNMNSMFSHYTGGGNNLTTFYVGDLSNWDTAGVINMSYMFFSVSGKITNWDIGNLNNWDVSSVRDMTNMFRSAGSSATTWNIGDLSNWDTGNVTNMSSMFNKAFYSSPTWPIGDISHWNVSKVTTMSGMFYSIGRNFTQPITIDLSHWDTSSLTNMNSMFVTIQNQNGVAINIDISSWDTSKVSNMRQVFYHNYATQQVYVGNGWSVASVIDSYQMFHCMYNIVGNAGTTYDGNHTDVEYARIDNPPDYPGYFTYKGDNPDNPGGGGNIVNNITNVFNNIFNNNNANNNTDTTQDPSSDYVEPMGVVNTNNNNSINWFLIICLCILSIGLILLIIFLIWKLRKQRKISNYSAP